MSTLTPGQLKKQLIEQGFEVFRTLGSRVVLAERVRDNLIMDSGVSVLCSEAIVVRVVVRAQASEFPGEQEADLFERARQLAARAGDEGGLSMLDQGYSEADASVVPIKDPGDASKTLDTWYEVAFEKTLSGVEDVPKELHFALKITKTHS